MHLSAPIALILLSSPLLAQTRTKAPAGGATNILNCVNSLKDQDGDGCIQASSVPTSGRLFPYPGSNNSFNPLELAFVGGGFSNTASGSSATVGGGSRHAASGDYATVGGGRDHIASGLLSTVGGGSANTASGVAATVGGGLQNTAYGFISTVGGGYGNTASGNYATVGGGLQNTALGQFSFATGRRAEANHAGSFVWGDSSPVGKTSSAEDQFNIYAEGGMRMFADGQTTPSMVVDTNGDVGIGTTAPAQLLSVNGDAGKPGGGSWSVFSDGRLKKNVEDLDGALETLLDLRGVSFEYKDAVAIGELEGERVGFIAQEVEGVLPDWVEDTETGYKQLTIRGFEALAVEALRELNDRREAEVAAKDVEIAALREEKDAEIAALRGELGSFKDEFASLKAVVRAMVETD